MGVTNLGLKAKKLKSESYELGIKGYESRTADQNTETRKSR
jgi:hypothetical protein